VLATRSTGVLDDDVVDDEDRVCLGGVVQGRREDVGEGRGRTDD